MKKIITLFCIVLFNYLELKANLSGEKYCVDFLSNTEVGGSIVAPVLNPFVLWSVSEKNFKKHKTESILDHIEQEAMNLAMDVGEEFCKNAQKTIQGRSIEMIPGDLGDVHLDTIILTFNTSKKKSTEDSKMINIQDQIRRKFDGEDSIFESPVNELDLLDRAKLLPVVTSICCSANENKGQKVLRNSGRITKLNGQDISLPKVYRDSVARYRESLENENQNGEVLFEKYPILKEDQLKKLFIKEEEGVYSLHKNLAMKAAHLAWISVLSANIASSNRGNSGSSGSSLLVTGGLGPLGQLFQGLRSIDGAIDHVLTLFRIPDRFFKMLYIMESGHDIEKSFWGALDIDSRIKPRGDDYVERVIDLMDRILPHKESMDEQQIEMIKNYENALSRLIYSILKNKTESLFAEGNIKSLTEALKKRILISDLQIGNDTTKKERSDFLKVYNKFERIVNFYPRSVLEKEIERSDEIDEGIENEAQNAALNRELELEPEFKKILEGIQQSIEDAEKKEENKLAPSFWLVGSPGQMKTTGVEKMLKLMGRPICKITETTFSQHTSSDRINNLLRPDGASVGDSSGSSNSEDDSRNHQNIDYAKILFEEVMKCKAEFGNPVLMIDDIDKILDSPGMRIINIKNCNARNSTEEGKRKAANDLQRTNFMNVLKQFADHGQKVVDPDTGYPVALNLSSIFLANSVPEEFNHERGRESNLDEESSALASRSRMYLVPSPGNEFRREIVEADLVLVEKKYTAERLGPSCRTAYDQIYELDKSFFKKSPHVGIRPILFMLDALSSYISLKEKKLGGSGFIDCDDFNLSQVFAAGSSDYQRPIDKSIAHFQFIQTFHTREESILKILKRGKNISADLVLRIEQLLKHAKDSSKSVIERESKLRAGERAMEILSRSDCSTSIFQEEAMITSLIEYFSTEGKDLSPDGEESAWSKLIGLIEANSHGHKQKGEIIIIDQSPTSDMSFFNKIRENMNVPIAFLRGAKVFERKKFPWGNLVVEEAPLFTTQREAIIRKTNGNHTNVKFKFNPRLKVWAYVDNYYHNVYIAHPDEMKASSFYNTNLSGSEKGKEEKGSSANGGIDELEIKKFLVVRESEYLFYDGESTISHNWVKHTLLKWESDPEVKEINRGVVVLEMLENFTEEDRKSMMEFFTELQAMKKTSAFQFGPGHGFNEVPLDLTKLGIVIIPAKGDKSAVDFFSEHGKDSSCIIEFKGSYNYNALYGLALSIVESRVTEDKKEAAASLVARLISEFIKSLELKKVSPLSKNTELCYYQILEKMVDRFINEFDTNNKHFLPNLKKDENDIIKSVIRDGVSEIIEKLE